MGNLWTELGYGDNYSILSQTETNISLVVLLIMGLLVMIRKNLVALSVVHGLIALGFGLAAIASWLFIAGEIRGPLWMQLTGLGLYMGYERLIASFRIAGNVGFLIYFADAFGYLGSVTVMLSKELLQVRLNWSQFYSHGVVICSMLGLAGTVFSFLYFKRKHALNKKTEL
jgi:hypothetical protein